MRRVVLGILFAMSVILAGCTGGNNNTAPGATTGGGEAPLSRGAPLALATTSPLAPTAGEEVTFDASGSNSANQRILGVAWEFGDGTEGEGLTTAHAYDLPGDYVIRFTVTNDADLAADNLQAPLYLRVSPAPIDFEGQTADTLAPVARLATDAQILRVGGTVIVNATGSHGWVPNEDHDADLAPTAANLPALPDAASLAAVEWDWGDGSPEARSDLSGLDDAPSAMGASHAYAAPGLYTIKLAVTASNGLTGSAAASVLVLPDPPGVGGYKFKDLFVTATVGSPESLDPHVANEVKGGHIIQQVYETLFDIDRGNTNRIVPVLAAEVPTVENGGIRENGTRYVIKLREGVKFHDGTPLTAEDVKFSLDRIVLLRHPTSLASTVAPVLRGAEAYLDSDGSPEDRETYLAENGVEVLDASTVAINLPRPNAAFFQRLAAFPASIVGAAAFKADHEERVPLWGAPSTVDGLPPAADAGARDVTRDPWADLHMVGTGPFKLRAWLPGDRVILDRFDGYWGEEPRMRAVIVQYVDDLNTRLLMLRSGDADEIHLNANEVERARPLIEGIARITASETLDVDAVAFARDVKDPDYCPRKADGTPDCAFFQDENVRKAFVLAFDYETFYAEVMGGRAAPLAGVIPRGMPGFDPDLAPHARDVEAAREALAASSYGDGFTVDVFYSSTSTDRHRTAELLKQNLEDLAPGKIQVNLQPRPGRELGPKASQSELPVLLVGWAADYAGTDNYVKDAFYHSSGLYPLFTSFEDSELDALIDAALEETDPERQAEGYARANRHAMETYAYLFLGQRTDVHVERTYVDGYYYSPLHAGAPNVGDYATLAKV